MTTRSPSTCDSCIHRLSESTCQAFPRGIPEDILMDGALHNAPRKGQGNRIVWEFAPGTDQEFQNWKESVEVDA